MPARAAGVELIGAYGGSGYRRPPALVRRADGQTFQLTPLLFRLLQAIDGKRDQAQLASVLSEQIHRHVTADDVRLLTEARLRPLGLLEQPDGSQPVVQKTNPLLALRVKLVVSDPERTRRLAAPFAFLFRPPIVVAFVAAFVAAMSWVAFGKGLASAMHQAVYEPALLLLVLALTLLSAAFHEVGHAAACRYGGARPGAMGVGLYLVWPAFYTDVTDAYRLGRGGRLRVDLGGLYFNAIFGVVTFGLWWAVRWDALLLVVAAQPVLMARQLVPFVRFDGYHVLADLVGVPDLFKHIKPTLLGILPTRWGRPEGKALKRWARAVIALWVFVTIPLLAALLGLMVVTLPRLLASAWDSAGLRWSSVETSWASADVAAVVVGLVSTLMACLPAVGSIYLLSRLGHRTVRRVWRATEGRPPLRAAAAVAAAALVGGVAWAWWPHDQYRPINPNERWSVLDVPRLTLSPLRRPTRAFVRVAATTPVPRTAHGTGGARAVHAPLARRGGAGAPEGGGAPRVPREPPLRVGGEPPGRLPVAPIAPGGTTGDGSPPGGSTAGSPAGAPTAAPRGTPVSAPGLEPSAADARPPAVPARPAWPFPFPPPREPQQGDNQARAVNTADGSTVSDVALRLNWVRDGGPVTERNEAYALASCRDCRTVAVAFQVILAIGQVRVVTPVNSAVAANYLCNACETHAVAVQLYATLAREPTDAEKAALERFWAQLERNRATLAALSAQQAYATLLAARRAILEFLAQGDNPVSVVTRTDQSQPGSGTTTGATTGTTTTGTTTTGTTTTGTTSTPTSTTTGTTTTTAGTTGAATTGQTSGAPTTATTAPSSTAASGDAPPPN